MTDVKKFYESYNAEWQRLESPIGRVEFLSTWALIEKYFPAACKVADIGGGPGRYTIELLKQGHQTTLLDLAENHISLAGQKIASLGLQADDLIAADARNVRHIFKGKKFDGILALGPLYHITDRAERIDFLRAIKECLNEGGTGIVAYLNSWGIAKSLVSDAPHWFADPEKVKALMNENTFAGPTACAKFTACHWSTPPAAVREIEEAGLRVLEYIGAEGFVNGMHKMLADLNDGDALESIVALAVRTSFMPQYRDATDHTHFVVAK